MPSSFIQSSMQSAHHDPGTVLGNGCEQTSKRNRLRICATYILAVISVYLLSDAITSTITYVAAQSHPALCDHRDCSPPGSSGHGILQASILEWVAMSSPRDLLHPGIKPGILHCRRVLYRLSHQGSRTR